jgi:hypothetical protein
MIPSTTTDQTLPNRLSQWLLEAGERPATFSALVDLYRHDHDRFYQLACVGVVADAPTWAKEIAELAAMVRHFVRSGFRFDENSQQLIGAGNSLYLGDIEFEVARQFLRELSGTPPQTEVRLGRDYIGAEASEAEVLFNIGSPTEIETENAQSIARNALKPHQLRVDDQDIKAIENGMPGYVIHELVKCATRVVQAPTAIFQGIRRKGRLAAGRAYCGRPKRAFDNEGKACSPPPGMVYCVYVEPEGYVFDWDWVREDPARPGFPIDYRLRFVNQINELTETVLLLPNMSPTPFRKGKAWHSYRGDCMFFYASDLRAYAKRVNDDLTEYRAIESDKLVGCKIKDFQALLSSLFRGDSSTVPVGAVLAASLVRQMAEHQQREKKVFLKLIAETALRIGDAKREEFFKALVQLDDEPDRYLNELCDLVLRLTDDPNHRVLQFADDVRDARRSIEEPYLRLIAVAGTTSVSAQAAA